MGWFEQICRNLGLMVHNIQNPDGPRNPPAKVERKVVSETVEEKKVDEKTTLRRTVIEEIEVRREVDGKKE